MSELLPANNNLSINALTADIPFEAVEVEDVVSGSPVQGIAELGTLGGIDAGIWELRGGVVTDTEVDEFFIVLSGGATIELLEVPGKPEEAGRVVQVHAGDVMRLVAGTRTRWTVDDHIRKVYITPGD